MIRMSVRNNDGVQCGVGKGRLALGPVDFERGASGLPTGEDLCNMSHASTCNIMSVCALLPYLPN